jgi:hypothetical protein
VKTSFLEKKFFNKKKTAGKAIVKSKEIDKSQNQ